MALHDQRRASAAGVKGCNHDANPTELTNLEACHPSGGTCAHDMCAAAMCCLSSFHMGGLVLPDENFVLTALRCFDEQLVRFAKSIRAY